MIAQGRAGARRHHRICRCRRRLLRLARKAGMINAVLDTIARELRADEFEPRS